MGFLVEADFDQVRNIIRAGQLDTLKADQCKIYLRKHGLRLTGSKDTMIRRIQEHLDVVRGGGHRKYPKSSFVVNCKGDACTGDVVLFEQKVYNKFNLASRSANGPPVGKRIVAGRIVKESYGSAKQQHTFTIEVLWSKGKKPFPPLHQLLIKGRNLYRLRTMRQKWDDEKEREKALLEKHSRGSSARANRDGRTKEKETKKNLTAARVPRKAKADSHQPPMNSMKSGMSILLKKPTAQPKKHRNGLLHSQKEHNHQIQRENPVLYSSEEIIQNPLCPDEHYTSKVFLDKPHYYARSEYLSQNVQHLGGVAIDADRRRSNFQSYEMQPVTRLNFKENRSSKWISPIQPVENLNCYPAIWKAHRQDHYLPSKTSAYSRAESSDMISDRHQMARMDHYRLIYPVHGRNPPIDCACGLGYKKPEICQHYARGRCYYGDNCRYLH